MRVGKGSVCNIINLAFTISQVDSVNRLYVIIDLEHSLVTDMDEIKLKEVFPVSISFQLYPPEPYQRQ